MKWCFGSLTEREKWCWCNLFWSKDSKEKLTNHYGIIPLKMMKVLLTLGFWKDLNGFPELLRSPRWIEILRRLGLKSSVLTRYGISDDGGLVRLIFLCYLCWLDAQRIEQGFSIHMQVFLDLLTSYDVSIFYTQCAYHRIRP